MSWGVGLGGGAGRRGFAVGKPDFLNWPLPLFSPEISFSSFLLCPTMCLRFKLTRAYLKCQQFGIIIFLFYIVSTV